MSEIEALRTEVKRLQLEIHYKNETLREKNLALDALHFVWCDGGCPTGVHRYTDETFTEEVVLQAEYQALRLRHKYNVMRWQIENFPTLPTTQSQWHRLYVERLKEKIGYMSMYDTILVDGRGDEGAGQVKLWNRVLADYHLGDEVPPGPGGVRSYSIAMREGGFVNIVDCTLVSWTDSAEQKAVFTKWGDPWDGYYHPDYVFSD